MLKKKDQYDAVGQEYNIEVLAIAARTSTKRQREARGAGLVKFTYRATVEIIQIDRGVNYRVNYTIASGAREVHAGQY